MNDIAERPSSLPWPPIVYLCAIALAVVLSYLVVLPWFGTPFSDILFAVGCLMIVGVVALYVSATRAMSRAKTTIKPTEAAAHLVTDGPFAISRNPLYLANTMLVFGVGLIAGLPWFLILAIVAAFVTQKLAVEPEEKHLAARFGKRYRDYAKKVRRWI